MGSSFLSFLPFLYLMNDRILKDIYDANVNSSSPFKNTHNGRYICDGLDLDYSHICFSSYGNTGKGIRKLIILSCGFYSLHLIGYCT